jgi:hypothetical protein
MKLSALPIIVLLLAACAPSKPQPKPEPRLADGSTVTVLMDGVRERLDQPQARWDAEAEQLEVVLTRARKSGEEKAPKLRMELSLNEPGGELTLENLSAVKLSYEDFTNRGSSVMRGGNTKAAIKALSGSAKPGGQVVLDLDFDAPDPSRGRVVATVR